MTALQQPGSRIIFYILLMNVDILIFLQTQYVFIHKALDELVTCGDTEIAAVNMRITIGKLSRTVEGISGFQKQFEVCRM